MRRFPNIKEFRIFHWFMTILLIGVMLYTFIDKRGERIFWILLLMNYFYKAEGLME